MGDLVKIKEIEWWTLFVKSNTQMLVATSCCAGNWRAGYYTRYQLPNCLDEIENLYAPLVVEQV